MIVFLGLDLRQDFLILSCFRLTDVSICGIDTDIRERKVWDNVF